MAGSNWLPNVHNRSKQLFCHVFLLVSFLMNRKMKKLWILWVGIFLAAACTNTSDDPIPSAQQTATILATGSWKVSYYYDNNRDETSDFSSYRFTFDASGNFTAMAGQTRFSGTWRRFRDDGRERLELVISGNDDMDEISDDWVILTIDDRKIELRDDSNPQDQLHLTRE